MINDSLMCILICIFVSVKKAIAKADIDDYAKAKKGFDCWIWILHDHGPTSTYVMDLEYAVSLLFDYYRDYYI